MVENKGTNNMEEINIEEEIKKLSLRSKVFGKAEVVEEISQRIINSFADDEKVIKAFKFLVDEVVLTNYGVYHWDKKIVGNKNTMKFTSYFMISGISYLWGGN